MVVVHFFFFFLFSRDSFLRCDGMERNDWYQGEESELWGRRGMEPRPKDDTQIGGVKGKIMERRERNAKTMVTYAVLSVYGCAGVSPGFLFRDYYVTTCSNNVHWIYEPHHILRSSCR